MPLQVGYFQKHGGLYFIAGAFCFFAEGLCFFAEAQGVFAGLQFDLQNAKKWDKRCGMFNEIGQIGCFTGELA